MLQFHIKDYEEFKSIFGTCKSARGCIQNRVLLDFWKYRFKIDGDGRASKEIRNVQDLYSAVIKMLSGHTPKTPYFLKSNSYTKLDDEGSYEKIERYTKRQPKCRVSIPLNNTTYRYFTKKYSNPSDGEPVLSMDKQGMLHLYNETNDRNEDVKAGRFITKVIEDGEARIGEAATLYVAEEFQRRVDQATTFDGNFELIIDKHFDWIYSSSYCDGSFGSCMCDKRRHSFYTKCVDASAAYIKRKSDGKIVARAILYHNVYSPNDKKLHNYLDRTYGIDESMKRLLTRKVVNEGYADLYKAVGAGCRDICAIMDAQGNRLDNPSLYINLYIENGQVMSFADTFKYYDYARGIASNVTDDLTPGGYQDGLDHTTQYWEGNSCKLTKDAVIGRNLSSLFA